MTIPRRPGEFALSLAAPFVLLGVWEVLARSAVISPVYWPPPTTLAETARDQIANGTLVADTRITLFRVLVGFVLGAVPGVLLGLAMGLFWPVRLLLMPIASAIYAIPKIALVPFALITFGIGETSKLFLVAISIVFLVMLSTMGGVLSLDPAYRDVARDFRASRWQVFTTVALPGTLPAIFTGFRLALGFALVVIVGTEFVSPGDGGIGDLIWESWQVLRIRVMFVGLIVTGLMGWGLTAALDLIERLVVPWETRR